MTDQGVDPADDGIRAVDERVELIARGVVSVAVLAQDRSNAAAGRGGRLRVEVELVPREIDDLVTDPGR